MNNDTINKITLTNEWRISKEWAGQPFWREKPEPSPWDVFYITPLLAVRSLQKQEGATANDVIVALQGANLRSAGAHRNDADRQVAERDVREHLGDLANAGMLSREFRPVEERNAPLYTITPEGDTLLEQALILAPLSRQVKRLEM